MEIRFVCLTTDDVAEIVVRSDGTVSVESDEKYVALNGISYPTRAWPVRHDRIHLFASNGANGVLGCLPASGSLYHYTKPTSALSILKTKTLRLSAFSTANDDFERNPRWFDIYSEGASPTGAAIEISKQLQPRLFQNWRFVSFSGDNSSWQVDTPFDSNFGSGWQNPSMWSHYGQRHSTVESGGCVLRFERRRLSEQLIAAAGPDIVLIGGQVRYISWGEHDIRQPYCVDYEGFAQAGIDQCARTLSAHFLPDYLLTKFDGWAHEREVRFLVNWTDDTQAVLNFGDTLDEILLGDGVDTSMRSEIVAAASISDVLVSQVRWRNGFPVRLSLQ